MKAAVVGCGRMGAFTSAGVRQYAPSAWLPLAHAEAIVAHGGLELAALCDASADNLARAQAAYGNPPGYTDVEALARDVRPDLVGIATRTIGRAAIIQILFEHGTRAFHIEKPLCNSVAELGAIERIFAQDDVFATYGAVRRYFHIYAYAVAMAHSGQFGELLEVRANFGPGALYWVQPHAVDLILYAARGRQVEGVQARLLDVREGDVPGVIASDPVVGAASIWFEGGLAGHIGRAPGFDLMLSCARGEIAVRSDGRRIDLLVQRGDDPYLVAEIDSPVPLAEGPQGALAPITQLVACLRSDSAAMAANRINKRDILLGQAISFAMVESHRQGSRIVTFDDVAADLVVMAKTGGNYA